MLYIDLEDKYAEELLKKSKELESGLKYYISETQKLRIQLKTYQQMYDNSVEERLNEVKKNLNK